jgi:hypothetical protein
MSKIKSIFILLIVLNLSFITFKLVGYVMGHYIEYYYNPVMKPGKFISGKEAENGYSVISYGATKIRTECRWLETKWYYGSPANIDGLRIPMFHGEKPSQRNAGVYIWDKTYINLPIDEIKHNSYAISVHSCNPFWNTYSLFFVGDNVASHYDK